MLLGNQSFLLKNSLEDLLSFGEQVLKKFLVVRECLKYFSFP